MNIANINLPRHILQTFLHQVVFPLATKTRKMTVKLYHSVFPETNQVRSIDTVTS